ncbi:hypothetical protein [Aliiroseovarius sp. PTFE2010]|uniref:hypothetical protein n=1 Tax=Aliiroseovarius sp. PTFE2010 TaxID=3417190 RepID=UPI003CF22DF2
MQLRANSERVGVAKRHEYKIARVARIKNLAFALGPIGNRDVAMVFAPYHRFLGFFIQP